MKVMKIGWAVNGLEMTVKLSNLKDVATTADGTTWIATLGGAACLGRDDIGSLAAGKAADLVVWPTTGILFQLADRGKQVLGGTGLEL